MKITIISLFPEIFSAVLNFSILKRAQEKGLVELEVLNLRDFGEGRHKKVDDKPYGGGVGMLLRADILAKAVKSITLSISHPGGVILGGVVKPRVILTSAAGTPYKQPKARELSKLNHLVLVCGHYEGVDQRFIDRYVDEEISIGDYILTGGELAALVIADSIIRLIPGVLEKDQATRLESFEDNLLEYPQYTRPEVFEGMRVPEILLSGDHQKIEKWLKEKAIEKTKKYRPDLLEGV